MYSIFSIFVVPLAQSPAKTKLAPPLKSVEITFAPYIFFVPFIIAGFPSIYIFSSTFKMR